MFELHPSVINDPRQFHIKDKQPEMEFELSMSYLFRGFGNSELLHSGLGYSQQLTRVLSPLVSRMKSGEIVVNIGDGLGYNSDALDASFKAQDYPVRLVNVDISPKLLIAQRQQVPGILFSQADALSLPFADSSVGGIVNNEMLADLPVSVFRATELVDMYNEVYNRLDIPLGYSAGDRIAAMVLDLGARKKDVQGWVDALSVLYEYQLNLPAVTSEIMRPNVQVAVQTGTIHFIENIVRVLKPGGWAWISEYGHASREFWAQPHEFISSDGFHTEWQTQFAQLISVVNTLGCRVSMAPLDMVMGFETDKWFVEHKDLKKKECIALSIDEALRLFPDIYRNTTFQAVTWSTLVDTSQDLYLQSLKKRGIRIQHMHNGQRGPYSSSDPILRRVGEITEDFWVLGIEKPG
jgi:SAM-dependent methyltransferase